MAKRSSRLAKAQVKSMKEASDSDEEPAQDEQTDDEQQGDEDVQHVQPPAKRARRQQAPVMVAVDAALTDVPAGTSTGGRKKKVAASVPESGSLDLIDLLTKYPEAARISSKAWVQRYQQQPLPATAELLTLLAQVAGAPVELAESDIEEHDVDALASKLQENVLQNGGLDPLHDRKRARTLPIGFASFFSCLVGDMDDAELLGRQADDYALDKLMHTLMALSGSSVRTFRLAATLAAARIVTALVEARKKRTQAAATAQFQRESEAKKGRAADQGLLKSLQQNVDGYQRQAEALTAQINELIKTIFAVRFRDTQAEVRALVIGSIGAWVAAEPSVFLADTHLKYLGWALSDRDAAVRLGAVTSLLNLYQDDANIQGLRDFKGRFLPRLKELPEDIDERVAVKGLELLAKLVKVKEVASDDVQELILLLADVNPAIRSAAALLVAATLQAEVEKDVQVQLAEQQAGGSTGRRTKTPSKTPASAGKKASAGDAAVSDMRQKAAVAALLNMMARMQEISTGQPTIKPKKGKGRAFAAATAASAAAEPLEQEVVAMLTDALYDRYPVVQDAGVLASCLVSMADQSNEELLGGPSGPAHLAALLAAAMDRAHGGTSGVQSPTKPGGSAMKKAKGKKAAASEASTIQDMTRAVMSSLAGAIRQYQTDPAVLAPLLHVASLLDLEVFALQGEEKALGQLLGLVAEQVMRHSDPAVLREAADCLVSVANTGPGTLRAAAQLALNNVTTKVAAGLSNATAAVAALPVDELREQIEELESAGDAAEVPEGAETVWQLKVALLRVASLLTRGASSLAANQACRTSLASLLGSVAGVNQQTADEGVGSKPAGNSKKGASKAGKRAGQASQQADTASGPRLLGNDVMSVLLVANQAALLNDLILMGVVDSDGKTDAAVAAADGKSAGDMEVDEDAETAAGAKPKPAKRAGRVAGGKKQTRAKAKDESESEGSEAEAEEQEVTEAAQGKDASKKQAGLATSEDAVKKLADAVRHTATCLEKLFDIAQDQDDVKMLLGDLLRRTTVDLLTLFGHAPWQGTPAQACCLPDNVIDVLLSKMWHSCLAGLNAADADEQRAEQEAEDELDEEDEDGALKRQVARANVAARKLVAANAAVRLILSKTALKPSQRKWLATNLLVQMPLHGQEISQLSRDTATALRKDFNAQGNPSGMAELLFSVLRLSYRAVMSESTAQEAGNTQAADSMPHDTAALENALQRFADVSTAVAGLYSVVGTQREELLALMKTGMSWVLDTPDPRPRMYFTAWGLQHFVNKLTSADAADLLVELDTLMATALVHNPREAEGVDENGVSLDPHWAQVDHFRVHLQERSAKGAAGRVGGRGVRSALKGGRAAAKKAAKDDKEGAGASDEEMEGEEHQDEHQQGDEAQQVEEPADKAEKKQPRKRKARSEQGDESEDEKRPRARARFAASGRATRAAEVADDDAIVHGSPEREPAAVSDQQGSAIKRGGKPRGRGAKAALQSPPGPPEVNKEGWHVKHRGGRAAAGKQAAAEQLIASDSELEEDRGIKKGGRKPSGGATASVLPIGSTQPLSEMEQLPRSGLKSKRQQAPSSQQVEQPKQLRGRPAGQQPLPPSKEEKEEEEEQHDESDNDNEEEEEAEDVQAEDDEGDASEGGEGSDNDGPSVSQNTQASEPPPRVTRRRRL